MRIFDCMDLRIFEYRYRYSMPSLVYFFANGNLWHCEHIEFYLMNESHWILVIDKSVNNALKWKWQEITVDINQEEIWFEQNVFPTFWKMTKLLFPCRCRRHQFPVSILFKFIQKMWTTVCCCLFCVDGLKAEIEL